MDHEINETPGCKTSIYDAYVCVHISILSYFQKYRLVYRVFDDKFANSTTVVIHVTDVNDNPPKFDNAIYNVTDVQEEEAGISESSPKYLLTVSRNRLVVLHIMLLIQV